MRKHLVITLATLAVLCTSASVLAAERNPAIRCKALIEEAESYPSGEVTPEYHLETAAWEKAYPLCQHVSVPMELRVKSAHRWASILLWRGEAAAAEGLYRRHIADLEIEAGRNAPGLRELLDGLISILGSQERFDEAVKLAKQRLDLEERIEGAKRGTYVVDALIALGYLMHVQKKDASAEAYFRQAIRVAEPVCAAGDCDPLELAYEALKRMLGDDPSRRTEFEQLSKKIDRLHEP